MKTFISHLYNLYIYIRIYVCVYAIISSSDQDQKFSFG